MGSTSVSTRLTKNDATDVMSLMSCPRATRVSRPARYASTTCSYTSTEKMSVMLIEIPSAMAARMAGTPSCVAGILTMTFGRSTAFLRRRASASVSSVERARSGETSIDANPSAPCVRSNTGRNTSHAPWISWMASASKISCAFFPVRASAVSWAS